MKKSLFNLVVIIIGSLIVVGLSRNIIRLLKSEKKVDEARLEVTQLETEQKELVERKAYLESDEFIEEQARNKLNMSQEGEQIVILPQEIGNNHASEVTSQELPPYRQWLQVFGW